MSRMILGRKLGMTQVFDETGRRIPVTVVKAGPMTVIERKSSADKSGYSAIKVGFEDATRQEKDDSVRWRGLTKGQVGVFEKAGIDVPKRVVREFRVREEHLDRYEPGQVVDCTLFNAGEIVDVTGRSKGKGFAGVMKRHNFRGFRATHGTHESFRGGGSIGASAWPSRVFRGKKMAGRMGDERVTVQNLRIVQVLEDDGLYLIRGAVPGGRNGLVMIRPAVKKSAHA
ncbi:MAG: 50S ribosomal protein L3 [Deltaproteobacteria bacterium]|nr:MAG: 50S ribosomal protein L3 [Deltaproteobacteria bacterium]